VVPVSVYVQPQRPHARAGARADGEPVAAPSPAAPAAAPQGAAAEPTKTNETPTEKPTPEPPKAPSPDQAPKAVAIDTATANAGTDAYGVKAGGGGGMGSPGSLGNALGPAGGGGGGGGLYRGYLAQALQRAVERDSTVNRRQFRTEVAIWVDARGRVSKAEVTKCGTEAKVCDAIVATLGQVSLDQLPPSDFRFPQLISVTGRRGV